MMQGDKKELLFSGSLDEEDGTKESDDHRSWQEGLGEFRDSSS
jgi:hypothetical protein